ncbi:glucokinase [Vallitalea longa]|uniref:Glucokinase n=1 Tax=Vallitalea longa TaxID=2936439 RepID=A0A9W5YF47_9FIRM|nr:ROK family protein [Vallitalea longa]GKX31536.1 glucokinase [Vallitalea longa]
MYYIGIDIGGTKISVTISDNKFNIIDKIKFLTDTYKEPEEILDYMVKIIKEISMNNNINIEQISSIGISCGGPLDSKKGIILCPPNLPKWNNINVKKYFETALSLPTYLLNDANACCVAEWKLGVGKGYKNIIFLTFGTGIGAGLVLDNKLYLGTDDQAGEIGHIRIDKNGPLAYGKKGSFESYCSGAGIKNLALIELVKGEIESSRDTLLHNYKKENIDTALIFKLANKKDNFCCEIINKSAYKLGLGLSILIDILNPDLIIIGSIYTRAEKYFKSIIDDVIGEEALPINRKTCKIVPASLGENIGDYAALITSTGNY